MLVFNSSATGPTTQSLELLLGGVPAAQLAWVSSWMDHQAEDFDLTTLTGLTNSTTPVTIVTAPPEDTNTYQLKAFQIKNQNTAAVTVIIQFDDTATDREILRVNLNQNDTLVYIDTEGWYVLDSYGSVKIVLSISNDGIILAQANPSAATLTDAYTVPTGKKFEGHVNVCNRSGSGTNLRVSLAPNGAADAVTQYLAYDLPIVGNDVYDSSEFKIDALDVVRVYATLATLTFTISGVEKVA